MEHQSQTDSLLAHNEEDKSRFKVPEPACPEDAVWYESRSRASQRQHLSRLVVVLLLVSITSLFFILYVAWQSHASWRAFDKAVAPNDISFSASIANGEHAQSSCNIAWAEFPAKQYHRLK